MLLSNLKYQIGQNVKFQLNRGGGLVEGLGLILERGIVEKAHTLEEVYYVIQASHINVLKQPPDLHVSLKNQRIWIVDEADIKEVI